MASWRQVWSPEKERYVLVPKDESALQRDIDHGIIVKGKFDAFQSPIDGSVIRTQKDYLEHCRRHNVVPADEFSPEWYEQKAKERAATFAGERSSAQRFREKQEIYEAMVRAEREHYG